MLMVCSIILKTATFAQFLAIDILAFIITEQPFANASAATQIMRANSSSGGSRPAMSRQNSLRQAQESTSSPGMGARKVLVQQEEVDGNVNIGGKNPPAYKLDTAAACQLVTSIFEDKVSVTFSPRMPCV